MKEGCSDNIYVGVKRAPGRSSILKNCSLTVAGHETGRLLDSLGPFPSASLVRILLRSDGLERTIQCSHRFCDGRALFESLCDVGRAAAKRHHPDFLGLLKVLSMFHIMRDFTS